MMRKLRQIMAYVIFPAQMFVRPSQRRYILRWVMSLWPGTLRRSPQPWLVFGAIDHIDQINIRGWRIFEYGSGGSTLYWLRRGAQVTSVEHDAAWYDRVRARIPSGAAIDYRLAPPEPPELPPTTFDPANPATCASASPPHDGRTYWRYVTQIDSFADASLDLVLVDGRARTACLAHAAPKVRPGGLLILDNSERAYYTRCNGAALASYRPLVFAGAVPLVPVCSQTTIYVRT